VRRDSRPGTGTRSRRAGKVGDRILFALCAAAGLLVVVTLVDVIYQLVNNGRPAIDRFGLGFLWHTAWKPNFSVEGAGALIYGTGVSALMALALATPLGIGIGLYLSMMAPRRVRAVVGPLVEMLAAVPSIIYGFWGLVVLVPFVNHLEPGLHSVLGFIPLFGPPSTTGISVFSAGIVLTVMILPIISALSRDLFLTVPSELKDGAEALGATRWEVIRGIVLPSTASGVGAAVVLALGRALGEAIAVSFVIGDVSGIHASLFEPGSTLAERIANQFLSAVNPLHTASMFYAGLVLVVISLLTSLAARTISGRFDVTTGMIARV
jgi:phosphate transport system permease protein